MSSTKQQIFDRVAVHLLTQKRQAMDANGDCQYRAPDGCKCALGCLITDRAYDRDMEGKSVHELVDSFGPVLPKYFEAHKGFLSELQMIHDVREPTMWWESLSNIAKDNGLKRSVLSRFRA